MQLALLGTEAKAGNKTGSAAVLVDFPFRQLNEILFIYNRDGMFLWYRTLCEHIMGYQSSLWDHGGPFEGSNVHAVC